jgi:4-hydroxybenzoate polyprenyltransferase
MMILPLLLLVIENPVLALNLAFFLMISFVFFRMLVNTIFLDIKDSNSDKKESLITIPIVFGEEKTLRFLRLITLFSVLQILLGVYFKLLPKSSLVFLFLVPYSFYYFSKSKIKDNFYLVNYILADAEFILWPLLIIFGEILL